MCERRRVEIECLDWKDYLGREAPNGAVWGSVVCNGSQE
jgi:hypothetical protein